MNILMLSPIPVMPFNAGDRVRIWHLAQGLARHAHVTLVLPRATQDDRWPGPDEHNPSQRPKVDQDNLRLVAVPLPAHTRWHQVKSLFSPWPYHVALRYQEEMRRTVAALLAQQDYTCVYCHFLQTLPYVAGANLPIILDQHNVDRIYWQRKLAAHLPRWRRWMIERNLEKNIRFEEKALPQLHSIVSVSEQDRRATATYAAPTVPHGLVAPNGVDTEHYRYRQPVATPTRKLTLGFLGSMELALNQEAVLTLLQKIYPHVQQQLPAWEVDVLVIGRQPPPWLRAWPHNKPAQRITITGEVPDILPYLHRVDLLVLPLQSGAGTKLRMVEAMAAGVPVIGTPLAWEGLDALRPGEHGLAVQQPQAFVEAICRLAHDEVRRRQLAQQARAVVERHYSWRTITDQLAQSLVMLYGKNYGTEKTCAHLSTLLP